MDLQLGLNFKRWPFPNSGICVPKHLLFEDQQGDWFCESYSLCVSRVLTRLMAPTAEESSLGGRDAESPSLVETFQTFREIVVLHLQGISSCTASRHGLQPGRLRCVAVPL